MIASLTKGKRGGGGEEKKSKRMDKGGFCVTLPTDWHPYKPRYAWLPISILMRSNQGDLQGKCEM